MMEQADGSKRRRFWHWMPAAVFSIGMLSCTLLLWANRGAERQHVNSLRSYAVMDMELRAARGHFKLEEAVAGGDRGYDAQTEIDEAIRLVDAVIGGGNSEHGLIPAPLKDPELRGGAEAIRAQLLKCKALSVTRLRHPEKGGAGSPLARQFHAAFDELFDKAEALDDAIGKKNELIRAESGRIFWGILSIWSSIVCAATAGLWSLERRRKSAEEGLLRANGQLSAQTEELAGHRRHLEELVEARTAQLSTANLLLRGEVAERRRVEEELRVLYEQLEEKIEERTRQLSEAQEELLRSEKLNMLGIVAGNVGNELRNPLGVMNNAVFFLKSLLAGADESVGEYLDIIGKEIDGCQRVLSDFIDFFCARPPRAKEVPVDGLISQSLAGCDLPENVTLCVDLQELLPVVKVDPSQMRQVFQNLITNAVQAMPEGGGVRIGARKAPDAAFRVPGSNPKPENRQEKSAPGFVAISVADSGAGIFPENMDKVFQPLFSTKSRGIGLGLSICKNFVEANGGRIEVESEFGKGTTFTVLLPSRYTSAGLQHPI